MEINYKMNTKLKTILLNGTKLYVKIYKEYYYFAAPFYGMELKLYKKDIFEFLKEPKDNFVFRESHGNCIDDSDRKIIIKFLNKQLGIKKYKTISRCLIYSNKYSLKNNLNLFSINELYEYLNK